jgi:hypothetical protein
VAKEVRRVVELLDGTVTIGVDAGGAGAGLVQELRRQNVRVVEMHMGGGGRIVRRLDKWSVPAHAVYEVVYQLLTQRRLKFNPAHPLTTQLVQEMDACETSHTPSGGTRYEVSMPGSHGDVLYAAGLGCLLHEAVFDRHVFGRSRRGGDDPRDREWPRPPGRVRVRTMTGREIVAARIDQSRQEAIDYAERERERFEQAGWGTTTKGRTTDI